MHCLAALDALTGMSALLGAQCSWLVVQLSASYLPGSCGWRQRSWPVPASSPHLTTANTNCVLCLLLQVLALEGCRTVRIGK